MRVARAIWAVLTWLFLILIPVQFYLAGRGAFDGVHAADKKFVPSDTYWGPHFLVGDILALLAILILISGLASRLSPRTRNLTIGLFVAMLVQYILPFFADAAQWIAQLHPVNALVVTGLAIAVAIRARPYLPIAALQGSEREPEPGPALGR